MVQWWFNSGSMVVKSLMLFVNLLIDFSGEYWFIDVYNGGSYWLING